LEIFIINNKTKTGKKEKLNPRAISFYTVSGQFEINLKDDWWCPFKIEWRPVRGFKIAMS
jgi:hypothetical protein